MKAVQVVQLPETVQAILAARIDRLPPEEKSLLQSASVVGKNVPLAELRAIAGLVRGRPGAGTRAAPVVGIHLRGAAVPRGRVHLQAHAHPRGRLREPVARTAAHAAREGRRGDRAASSGRARRAPRPARPPRLPRRVVEQGDRASARPRRGGVTRADRRRDGQGPGESRPALVDGRARARAQGGRARSRRRRLLREFRHARRRRAAGSRRPTTPSATTRGRSTSCGRSSPRSTGIWCASASAWSRSRRCGRARGSPGPSRRWASSPKPRPVAEEAAEIAGSARSPVQPLPGPLRPRGPVRDPGPPRPGDSGAGAGARARAAGEHSLLGALHHGAARRRVPARRPHRCRR